MAKCSRSSPRRLGVAFLALALLMVSACSDPRPTVAEWEPTWKRISEAIPSELTSGEDPSQATCSEVLAFLRTNRAELFPTPDPAIDDTVTDWVEVAESAFFECPPTAEPAGGFSEAYGQLLRLQGEIEVVLDMDRTP